MPASPIGEAIRQAVPPASEQQRERDEPGDGRSRSHRRKFGRCVRDEVAENEERIEPGQPREQVRRRQRQKRQQPDHTATTAVMTSDALAHRVSANTTKQTKSTSRNHIWKPTSGSSSALQRVARGLGERDSPERHLDGNPREVGHEQRERLAADEAHRVRAFAAQQHVAAHEREERHIERHHRAHRLRRAQEQLELRAQVQNVRHARPSRWRRTAERRRARCALTPLASDWLRSAGRSRARSPTAARRRPSRRTRPHPSRRCRRRCARARRRCRLSISLSPTTSM